MELYSKISIKNLLKKYQIHLSKKLGQNFLVDKKILEKIIITADLKPKDIILEIGSGIGNLTMELAKKVKRVIAVEKDAKMCEILKETLKDFKNIEIINKDILKVLNSQFSVINYKVIANLPYYIVSPVIRKLLEKKNPPQVMILMVQKEVAQRICAKPPKMSILSTSVQFYAKPEIITYVSRKSFFPQPKVDSAIIKITPSTKVSDRTLLWKGETIDKDLFFNIVKAGFKYPRKQLINNLSRLDLIFLKKPGLKNRKLKDLKISRKKIKIWLLKNKIQPTQRAETLSIKDWINLTKTYNQFIEEKK